MAGQHLVCGARPAQLADDGLVAGGSQLRRSKRPAPGSGKPDSSLPAGHAPRARLRTRTARPRPTDRVAGSFASQAGAPHARSCLHPYSARAPRQLAQPQVHMRQTVTRAWTRMPARQTAHARTAWPLGNGQNHTPGATAAPVATGARTPARGLRGAACSGGSRTEDGRREANVLSGAHHSFMNELAAVWRQHCSTSSGSSLTMQCTGEISGCLRAACTARTSTRRPWQRRHQVHGDGSGFATHVRPQRRQQCRAAGSFCRKGPRAGATRPAPAPGSSAASPGEWWFGRVFACDRRRLLGGPMRFVALP